MLVTLFSLLSDTEEKLSHLSCLKSSVPLSAEQSSWTDHSNHRDVSTIPQWIHHGFTVSRGKLMKRSRSGTTCIPQSILNSQTKYYSPFCNHRLSHAHPKPCRSGHQELWPRDQAKSMNPSLFHSSQNDHREFCLFPLFQSATHSNTSLANLPISALLYQLPHLLWPRSSGGPMSTTFLFPSYTSWINSLPPE